MKIYIHAATAISPQKTFGQVSFLSEPVEYVGNRLKTIEPDYKNYIDAKLLRRMSRIVKMGVATASQCLQDAGIEQPDAIVTGTAFGCLEDTGVFATNIIEQKEEMLQPTAFIQSTHNTVGGQIALMLKCHNYNNTFVHRGFSFESALLDATLLLREQEAANVLVGGTDEITEISHDVCTRLGLYKRTPISNFQLLSSDTKGTMGGEGAAFFSLSSKYSDKAYAELTGTATFYKPDSIEEIQKQILSFLSDRSVNPSDLDLIILGRNGNGKGDDIYNQLQQSIFSNRDVAYFKHLSGEFETATSFALWMAAKILQTQSVPASTGYKGAAGKSIKKILIYNHSHNIHHSLMLLSAVNPE